MNAVIDTALRAPTRVRLDNLPWKEKDKTNVTDVIRYCDSFNIQPMFFRCACVWQMALTKTTIVYKTQARFAIGCCFRQRHLPHTSMSRKDCRQVMIQKYF